jgi:bifunctional DNA-binding transcriptional regulator/antitoxin component of YhaV-PrlF toxin-antitoxin module
MEAPTKITQAEKLFSRPEGATMDEVAKATGDYQYNVLRRLEARGFSVRKKREGRTTRYWAIAPTVQAFDLTVSANGQTTLPKEVRRKFGVDKGGRVRLVLESATQATLAPASIGLGDLRGILKKPQRTATLDEIEEGIVRGATRT